MSEPAPELRPTPDPLALLRGAVGEAVAAEEEIAAEARRIEEERDGEG